MTDFQKPLYISFTGADDKTDLKKLVALDERWPGRIEWGVLYFPEKQGQPRNPSDSWIRELHLAAPWMITAAHLCGTRVFQDILYGAEHPLFIDPEDDPDVLMSDHALLGFDLYQLNINARRQDFTPECVHQVYNRFFEHGKGMILQMHDDSRETVHAWLQDKVRGFDLHQFADRLHNLRLLYDQSRGTGTAPKLWPDSTQVAQFPEYRLERRYAGGVNEDNVLEIIAGISQARASDDGVVGASRHYILDLESGARTDNEFDLDKVDRILYKVYGDRG
jgi:hypothetical protein